MLGVDGVVLDELLSDEELDELVPLSPFDDEPSDDVAAAVELLFELEPRLSVL